MPVAQRPITLVILNMGDIGGVDELILATARGKGERGANARQIRGRSRWPRGHWRDWEKGRAGA